MKHFLGIPFAPFSELLNLVSNNISILLFCLAFSDISLHHEEEEEDEEEKEDEEEEEDEEDSTRERRVLLLC